MQIYNDNIGAVCMSNKKPIYIYPPADAYKIVFDLISILQYVMLIVTGRNTWLMNIKQRRI